MRFCSVHCRGLAELCFGGGCGGQSNLRMEPCADSFVRLEARAWWHGTYKESSVRQTGQQVPAIFSRFLGWHFRMWSLNVALGHFSAIISSGNLIQTKGTQSVCRTPKTEGPQLQPVLPLHHQANPVSLAGVKWKAMPAAHPPERQEYGHSR